MNFIWVIIGAVIVLCLLSGGNKSNKKSETDGSIRIDHPHVVDDDDFECSVCHKRFRRNTMICPFCGARFTAQIEDLEEKEEEEEELDAWDEEDGI